MSESVNNLVMFTPLLPLFFALLLWLQGAGKKDSVKLNLFLIGSLMVVSFNLYYVIRTTATVLVAAHHLFLVDAIATLFSLATSLIILMAGIYTFFYSRRSRQTSKGRSPVIGSYLASLLLLMATMNYGFFLRDLLYGIFLFIISAAAVCLALASFNREEPIFIARRFIKFIALGAILVVLGSFVLSGLFYDSEVYPLFPGLDHFLAENRGEWGLESVCALAGGLLFFGFLFFSGGFPAYIWQKNYSKRLRVVDAFLINGLFSCIGLYGMYHWVAPIAHRIKHLGMIIIFISLVGMLFGAIRSFTQKELRKYLLYVAIVQVAMVMLGITVKNGSAFSGGLFHIFNQLLLRFCLVGVLGGVMFRCRSARITQLGGLAKKMPISFVLYFGIALALGGMPPFSSFWSFTSIVLGLVEGGYLWVAIAVVFANLLFFVSLLSMGRKIFLGRTMPAAVSDDLTIKEPPFGLLVPVTIIAVITLILGLFPQIISPLIKAAGDALLSA